jgi:hypothetical protein
MLKLIFRPMMTAKAPGYKAYETRTTRQIPMVLLRPDAGA